MNFFSHIANSHCHGWEDVVFIPMALSRESWSLDEWGIGVQSSIISLSYHSQGGACSSSLLYPLPSPIYASICFSYCPLPPFLLEFPPHGVTSFQAQLGSFYGCSLVSNPSPPLLSVTNKSFHAEIWSHHHFPCFSHPLYLDSQYVGFHGLYRHKGNFRTCTASSPRRSYRHHSYQGSLACCLLLSREDEKIISKTKCCILWVFITGFMFTIQIW